MGIRRSTSFGPQHRRGRAIWQTNTLTPTGSINGPRMTADDMLAQIEGSMAVLAEYRAAEQRREQMLKEFARIGYGPDTLVLDVIPGGRK